MEASSELKYIYSNVDNMLKFAEAKHCGLIVFNSAIVIGLLTCYSSIAHILCKPTIVLGILFLGVSLIFCIISQFPNTKNAIHCTLSIAEPNLYFYKHLSCLDLDGFIEKYRNLDEDFSPSKLEKQEILIAEI